MNENWKVDDAKYKFVYVLKTIAKQRRSVNSDIEKYNKKHKKYPKHRIILINAHTNLNNTKIQWK